HNSVRRPLEYMKSKGVEVTYIRPNDAGDISLEDIISAVQKKTKLIAATHASNVTGNLIDIRKIGHWAKSKGIRLLVDASQTAGIFPINVQTDYIDLLAVTGHKSLYGPQGTGFLYLPSDLDLVPLLHGGTGGNSESADQPLQLPDRYEAGTRNVVGIAGLGAGLDYVNEIGIDSIYNHESKLTGILLTELQKIDRVQLLGPAIDQQRAPIVSFTVRGMDSAEIGFILDQQFDIAVRTGLHCAPLTHEVAGTIETGAVRVSHSMFTTEDEIIQFLYAVDEITKL
ncbi:MAG: cysteine desulfurase, partial [Bacilli bacterium]|nr:cysteine desulfurase [Bacilli bacterium]